MENGLLKKLEEIKRQTDGRKLGHTWNPSEAIKEYADEQEGSLSALVPYSKVSRSGYYEIMVTTSRATERKNLGLVNVIKT